MNIVRFGVFVVVLLVSACGPRQLEPDEAIECDQCDNWNQPQDPFRVHGNTWYVGTKGLSSILIESDEGLILIDGGLPQSAALIEANIRNLGFDAHDVKAILVSHAHYDHVGGLAALQRLTGANVYASQAALRPLTTGRLVEDDPQYVADSDEGSFPPVRQVVAVDDGVYADSLTAVSAQGFKFTSSGVGDEIAASAGKVGDLDCDILLTPHPFFFGMDEKLERIDQGNPFVNNVGCLLYAESSLQWLEQRLQAERSH
jgi:metallo-beta-lactamase class B